MVRHAPVLGVYGPAASDGGAPVLTGTGAASSHHGELLQGVFEQDGRLRRGLVTLPCSLFGSRARIRLSRGGPELTVSPSWKTKALAAAHATLAVVGLTGYGGRLELDGDVRVGLGFGSSTCDVTATIFAVLAAAGRHLPAERVARIAVDVEAAADPLMFDRMLLFGQREGVVIEDLRRTMIPVEVLGFAFADGGLETLAFQPARYSVWEIECFRAMRGLLRRAVAEGDRAALGRVATASAGINQRFHPVPRFNDLRRLVEKSAALGLQVAHSGTVAGLLFDPDHPQLERRLALAARGLRDLGFAETWRYTSRNEGHAGDDAAS
ncbi:GHMP family kinase ATP-binding protein [Actinomadura macra]|uniref:GHMP family kinase ATP-binding protein n=1 Tax=Actinomadura macra TaxID=46164 RepID=UPI0009FD363A|nr:GHMP kinase [Actinomadura macra]